VIVCEPVCMQPQPMGCCSCPGCCNGFGTSSSINDYTAAVVTFFICSLYNHSLPLMIDDKSVRVKHRAKNINDKLYRSLKMIQC
jgi:hypothetical protein